MVLSRDLYANGRNVCRINGSLVNNAALRTVSEKLIDIHGQHEHQSLLVRPICSYSMRSAALLSRQQRQGSNPIAAGAANR